MTNKDDRLKNYKLKIESEWGGLSWDDVVKIRYEAKYWGNLIETLNDIVKEEGRINQLLTEIENQKHTLEKGLK